MRDPTKYQETLSSFCETVGGYYVQLFHVDHSGDSDFDGRNRWDWGKCCSSSSFSIIGCVAIGCIGSRNRTLDVMHVQFLAMLVYSIFRAHGACSEFACKGERHSTPRNERRYPTGFGSVGKFVGAACETGNWIVLESEALQPLTLNRLHLRCSSFPG